MTELTNSPAWGHGLATVTETADKVLDTYFPEPHLGRPDGSPHPLAQAEARDERRGVLTMAVTVEIDDLSAPPEDAHDGYLRLHLLSHRLVKPREINLNGLFGV